MRHSKKHSKKSSFIKEGNLKYLIPVIILLIIAIASWSWLLLDFPAVSGFAEPYINKYLKGLIEGRQASVETGSSDTNSSSTVKDSNDSVPDGDDKNSSTTDDKSSATTAKDNKRPTIKLQIYEGPKYSETEDACYYMVKAVVTGDPKPQVMFSKDDSAGTAGPDSARINLKRGTKTYTLTATATNEHGTVMDSMTLVWGCNLPPEIAEIKLSSDIMYVSKQYDISVIAGDPDWDALTYKWTVAGGTLDSYSAGSVKWSTPQSPDDYEVKVEVTDSKGAKTAKAISVYVGSEKAPETTAPPSTTASPSTTAPSTTQPPSTTTTDPQYQTVSVSKKTDEGGYVEYGGQTYAGANVYAGDSSANKPCMGFISFDISGLSGKTIQSANLKLSSATVYGSPLEYCDALWINVVDWGSRPIQQSDFNLSGTAVQSFASPGITCTADKLKSELQKAINEGKSRFQLRIHFSGPHTDSDDSRDGWEYLTQNISLSVTY
jgi:hypothetical protein